MSGRAGKISGLLLVDKPAGITSFDVVRRVRVLTGQRKVGHTGTLDPFATGILPVCIGSATRLAGLLTAGDKTYDATVELGVRTDTLDVDGNVLSRYVVDERLSEGRVREVLSRFVGTISQVPPMYSAVKVAGKRLHRYAREGAVVARSPRQVTIHAIELRAIELPRITIRVRCSKGTYVRVLAADIGDDLGCGAHLAALRRLTVGVFDVADARTLAQLEEAAASSSLGAAVIPLVDMLPGLPCVELGEEAAGRVVHGNVVALDIGGDGRSDLVPGRRVKLCRRRRLLAIGEVIDDPATARPRRIAIQPRTVLAEN